ncbi:hypothetical protein AAMO2058_000430200 [Amorphochlora amoebiformis]
MLLTSSSSGSPVLYQLDGSTMRISHRFREMKEINSVHCNSDDTLYVASGQSTSIHIYDLNIGDLRCDMPNVHHSFINVCRFANTMPSIMVSSSLDCSIKLWDLRSKRPVMLLRRGSGRPNVTVSFSPDDSKIVVSAVDNHILQYDITAGRSTNVTSGSKLKIPEIGCSFNYSRAYYTASGENILIGSSNESSLHLCDAFTGSLLRSTELYHGQRGPSMYVQSLRGHPVVEGKVGVLVSYRYKPDPFEIVLLDFDKLQDGSPQPFVSTACSLWNLGTDILKGVQNTGDILLLPKPSQPLKQMLSKAEESEKVSDGKPRGSIETQKEEGDVASGIPRPPPARHGLSSRNVSPTSPTRVVWNPASFRAIRCDRLILRARWPWFRRNEINLVFPRIVASSALALSSTLAFDSQPEGKHRLGLESDGEDESTAQIHDNLEFEMEVPGIDSVGLRVLVGYICTGDLIFNTERTETTEIGGKWISEWSLQSVYTIAKETGLDGFCQLVNKWILHMRMDLVTAPRISRFARRVGARVLLACVDDFIIRTNGFRGRGIQGEEKELVKKQSSREATVPGFLRRGHTVDTYKGLAYVIGGYDPESGGPVDLTVIPAIDVENSVWWLLPSTCAKSKVAPKPIRQPLQDRKIITSDSKRNRNLMPDSLCFHASCLVGNTIFTFGGGTDSFCTNNVWALDLSNLTWSRVVVSPSEALETEPRPRKEHNPSPGFTILVRPLLRGRVVLSDLFILRYEKTSDEWSWWRPRVDDHPGAAKRYLHTCFIVPRCPRGGRDRNQGEEKKSRPKFKDTIGIFGGYDKDRCATKAGIFTVDRTHGRWVQQSMGVLRGNTPPPPCPPPYNSLSFDLSKLYICGEGLTKTNPSHDSADTSKAPEDKKSKNLPANPANPPEVSRQFPESSRDFPEEKDEKTDRVVLRTRDGRVIVCYRKMLAWRSDFFKRMFKSCMMEGNHRVITIDQITHQALKSMVGFLHTHEIPRVPLTDPLYSQEHGVVNKFSRARYLRLTRIHLPGPEITSLQNTLINLEGLLDGNDSKIRSPVFRTAFRTARIRKRGKELMYAQSQPQIWGPMGSAEERETVLKVLAMIVYADRFGLEHFRNRLERRLQPFITLGNVYALYEFSRRFNSPGLSDLALNYLVCHTIRTAGSSARRRGSGEPHSPAEKRRASSVGPSEDGRERIDVIAKFRALSLLSGDMDS